MYDSLFYRVKQTVYKWWCVVYKPVYKLMHHGYWPAEKEPYYVPPEEKAKQVLPEEETSKIEQEKIPTAKNTSEPTEIAEDVSANVALKAQEILDRLAKEAAEDEASKQAEIAAARKKADQEAIAASIISNQRDISKYISTGMANRENNK